MIDHIMDQLVENATLSTERLRLRPFCDGDCRDVLEFASDTQTVKYLLWEGVRTIDEAMEAIHGRYAKPGTFAIEHLCDRKCIGSINLKLKPKHDKSGLGYVLNRQYWNQGYMTEVLSAILSLCFHILELNRVEADYCTSNPASGRVMEKCGMRFEWLAKEELKVGDRFLDFAHYGITRADWIKRSFQK